MGSCVSLHKDTSESAMKLGITFPSKIDHLQIPQSPIKHKLLVNAHPPFRTFQSYGSKEETFFDSQPWLESDCEDDFFSVNGDFTPSRGNTPVHHRFSMGTPNHNKTTFENKPPSAGSILQPSPTGKKRLSELFRENLRDEQDADNLDKSEKKNTSNENSVAKQTILDILPKYASSTRYISGTNSVCCSERISKGDGLFERERSIKSKQCCLPSLMSCRSFTVRKKKMSTTIDVHGEV